MLLRTRVFSFKNIITPILGGGIPLLGIKHNIESYLSITHSCFVWVYVPDNRITDVGATALVEAFKQMPNLEQLNLGGEFWIVDIPRSLTMMSLSKACYIGPS